MVGCTGADPLGSGGEQDDRGKDAGGQAKGTRHGQLQGKAEQNRRVALRHHKSNTPRPLRLVTGGAVISEKCQVGSSRNQARSRGLAVVQAQPLEHSVRQAVLDVVAQVAARNGLPPDVTGRVGVTQRVRV